MTLSAALANTAGAKAEYREYSSKVIPIALLPDDHIYFLIAAASEYFQLAKCSLCLSN